MEVLSLWIQPGIITILNSEHQYKGKKAMMHAYIKWL